MITTFASDISVQCLWYARRANRNQILITMLNSGGGAFNLTGYTASFKIWLYGQESSPSISLTQGGGITNGGAAGTLLLDITEAQSTLPPNIFLMKLEMVHPDTFTRTWFNGTWVLNGDLYDGAATTAVTVNLNATGTPVSLTINQPGDILDQLAVAIVGGAPNTYAFNFVNQRQRMFVGGSASVGLASDFTIQLSNNAPALVFDWQFFVPASSTRSITCPSSFKFSQNESKFNNASGVITITSAAAIEKYEMSGTFDGSKWACKLAGPYYA